MTTSSTPTSPDRTTVGPDRPAITDVVREKYGAAARRVQDTNRAASCCGAPDLRAAAGGDADPGCGGDAFDRAIDPITADLYAAGETNALPTAAVLASLGCGNPTALARLDPGDVVLDLGSGGGIDVLLSARRVGPTGRAYGLDMTDDMLALARRNAADAGVTNVEFLRGQIEAIPLPSASVDVVISNCVINLSGDKRRVLAEAFRVLKPGGRFAVSDVVVRGEVPAEIRQNMALWVSCIAGALEETEFTTLLTEVGFDSPAIEPTRVYRSADARAFLEPAGVDVAADGSALDGTFMAAFIRARKPGPAVSAAPTNGGPASSSGPTRTGPTCSGPDAGA